MITVKEGHDLAHKLKDRLHKELPELGHVYMWSLKVNSSDEKNKKRDQIY
jgi:divalent metal cation (Fe/Co/Zn/Cd) transporter